MSTDSQEPAPDEQSTHGPSPDEFVDQALLGATRLRLAGERTRGIGEHATVERLGCADLTATLRDTLHHLAEAGDGLADRFKTDAMHVKAAIERDQRQREAGDDDR